MTQFSYIFNTIFLKLELSSFISPAENLMVLETCSYVSENKSEICDSLRVLRVISVYIICITSVSRNNTVFKIGK